MQRMLKLWEGYENLLIVDLSTLRWSVTICYTHLLVWGSGYRSKGACDIERYKNTVVLEAEKAEEKLMSSWYPKVITLFSDPKLLPKLPKDRMDGFFECSYTLIGNQVDESKFVLPLHTDISFYR